MGGRARGAEITGKINRKDGGLNLPVQIFEGRLGGRRGEPTPQASVSVSKPTGGDLWGPKEGQDWRSWQPTQSCWWKTAPMTPSWRCAPSPRARSKTGSWWRATASKRSTTYGAPAPTRRTCPELPEIVLLDLNPPRLHGLEVLRRLRADARTKYLPVVVLTSVGARAGHPAELRLGRQQLRPQAGRLRPVRGGGPTARRLLVVSEPEGAGAGSARAPAGPAPPGTHTAPSSGFHIVPEFRTSWFAVPPRGLSLRIWPTPASG